MFGVHSRHNWCYCFRDFFTECEAHCASSPVGPRESTAAKVNSEIHINILATAMAQWLRCCATNRKVACSIPAGVIGIFH